MTAYEHASFCMNNVNRLYREYNRVSPIFRTRVLSRDAIMPYPGLIYCHPEDADVEYIEDFKHTYCDL